MEYLVFSPPNQMATKEQLAALTHLPAAFVGRTNKGRGKGKGGEKLKFFGPKTIALSNDSAFPFLKTVSARSQIFSTVESLATANFLASSTSVPVYTATAFSVASIHDISSFVSVFDQYFITCIEVLIEPQVSETTSAATSVGDFITVIDLDDNATPSNYNDLCSYPEVAQSKGTASHYHRWRPNYAIAAYSGAFTSYAATDANWIDCGSTGVLHYGIKAASTVSTVAQTYTIQTRLHVSFRARH
jgi:hypothetical protein